MTFYIVQRPASGLFVQAWGAFTRECDANRKMTELNSEGPEDWRVAKMLEWEVKLHGLMMVIGCGC